MAKLQPRPRMLGLSKLLIFGIPLAGLILLAISWLGQPDLSNIAQAQGRITACDVGKTSSRFRGDTVFFEILIDSQEPNHFGFSKPDAFFDDVYRLCLEKPLVSIKYVQDESKFYSEIGNWIVALKSVDNNEDIFTLQDYEIFLAEADFPWLYLGIFGGMLWLIALFYLYQNHRRRRELEKPCDSRGGAINNLAPCGEVIHFSFHLFIRSAVEGFDGSTQIQVRC